MKINWNQIFCRHVYETEFKKYDRTVRRADGGEKYGCPTYSNYDVYISKRKCLKCEKIRLDEFEVWLI